MISKKLVKRCEKLFKQYVPACGKCETLGGELLRAICKMRYRWYNDGDKFFKGYGVETAGSSAIFLRKNGFETTIKKMIDVDDETYDDMVDKFVEEVINHLEQNPILFDTWNDDDSVEGYYNEAMDEWYEEEEEDEWDYYEDDNYSN